MKPKEPKDRITEVLRRAALKSGLTAYALAHAAGSSYRGMWTFMRGKGNLNLTAAGRLADVLGLELRPKKGKVNRGKR